MRRIKYFIKNVKSKVANIPFLKLLVFFRSEICGGYRIYTRLKKEHGRKTKLLICPHTGTGDIYMIGLHLQEYLKKEHIDQYSFIFRGKSEKKIGNLFNIRGTTILDNAETLKLIRFAQFINPSNLDLIQLHHYPYAPQSHMHLEHFEGYKGITFAEMFQYISFKLGENTKTTVPNFKRNKEMEKIFHDKNLKPGKTVILAPYSSSIKYIPMDIWEKIASSLKEIGYTVATNCVPKKEMPIAGTIQLSFEYDVSVSYLEYAGYFIGIRSGICDIISSAQCAKIILYPMWDISLPWAGIPGKTLRFFGLNNNYVDANAVEIEFDNESISQIPSTVLRVFNENNFDKKFIKLRQNLQPAFANKTAIVIVFNEYFAPIASVALQSIIEFANQNNSYDIFLLNDGLNIRTKYMLMSVFQSKPNFSVRFIDYRYLLVNYSFHVERGYTPITYGRLASPHLLKEFDKIIYLDSDLIMNSDVAELYKWELKDNLIAAVRDLPMIAWASDKDNEEHVNIYKKLKLSSPEKYINAGVLIINNQLFNQQFPLKRLLQLSISRQWRWMDQDILNKLCDGKIMLLPQEYNVLTTSVRDDEKIIRNSYMPELIYEYRRTMEKPKIIHYIGCSFYFTMNPPRYLEKYWSIAKKSAYYETMIQRSMLYQHARPRSIDLLEKIVAMFRN